jgi:hypothetical protein
MSSRDPAAAFANIRKALRPGAVLSFVCWQSVFDNEWMLIPGAAVAGVTGSLPPMPGPDEPGPFSLADPGRVHAVPDAAGFGSVTVAPHADYVVISEDQISEAALASVRVGGIRDALRDADDLSQPALTLRGGPVPLRGASPGPSAAAFSRKVSGGVAATFWSWRPGIRADRRPWRHASKHSGGEAASFFPSPRSRPKTLDTENKQESLCSFSSLGVDRTRGCISGCSGQAVA